MAWTVPMTFADNNVLTAAQLNTHLRDNLLETAPAKATVNGGGWFINQGPYKLEERIIKSARAPSGFIDVTSTTYVGMPNGPSVTVETGTDAIVLLACLIGNNTIDTTTNMSFAVTGDTEREPDDKHSVQTAGLAANTNAIYGATYYLSDLNPGVNVFTCKYKVSANLGRFNYRFIGVVPL